MKKKKLNKTRFISTPVGISFIFQEFHFNRFI